MKFFKKRQRNAFDKDAKRKRQYILRKKIFAVSFFVLLFSFAAANALSQKKEMLSVINEQIAGIFIGELPDTGEIEEVLTEELFGKMYFVETYGAMTEVLGKKEFNNFSYIKDETGTLQYASFYREDDIDFADYAMRIRRLSDAVAPKDTKVLCVIAPTKYVAGETSLRYGLPANDPSAMVNEFLYYVNQYGVEYLDLRESFPNETMSLTDCFYRSDHHWTVPAAYYATGVLVDTIKEKFGENLDPTGYYTGEEAYERVTYHKVMLGSSGRNTGAFYVGLEDFTALFPNFTGDFRRESFASDGSEYYAKGNFAETMLAFDELTENESIYHVSPNALYLNELRTFESIRNKENEDGPSILFIRDSYFSPVIAFLSPMCSQIDAIYSLADPSAIDIEAYVTEHDFDYIVVEAYPYNLSEDCFQFFYD